MWFFNRFICDSKSIQFGYAPKQAVPKERNRFERSCKPSGWYKKAFETLRTESEETFGIIFKNVSMTATKLGVNLSVPRLTSRQINRAHIQDFWNLPEDYYRITIFYPFLDTFTQQINEKFINHKEIVKRFSLVFSHWLFWWSRKFRKTHRRRVIEDTVSSKDDVMAEYLLWCQKVIHLSEKTQNALNALRIYSKDIYPNIFRLLQILTTLPVSTTTPERTFSHSPCLM